MTFNIKKELEHNTLTLEKVLTSIWELISDGTANSNKSFHTPVIGTVTNDSASIRTVVLRKFDLEKLLLIFHTDIRSNKIQELIDNSNLTWLFYDPTERVQVRILSSAVILTDGDLFEAQWNSTQLMSRRCYTITEKPGTITASPSSGIPNKFVERLITESESELGKGNFAVVASRIKSINWLFLKSSGNISAEFNFTENGIIQNWIIP
jgi:hypothetical protein